MTYPTMPPQPQWQPPVPPPAPRKRHHVWRWVIGAIAVAAIAGGVASTNTSNSHQARPPQSLPGSATIPAAPPAAPQTDAPAEEETTPEDTGPSYVTPTRADFTVTLKILSKQCFGTAGCNVTYRPELTLNLPVESLDPAATYDVTYVVHGDESGAITDTISLTGGQYQRMDGAASTTSSSTKLAAVVTAVEPE